VTGRWIRYVAGRWFRPGHHEGPSLAPAAAGIGVGVAALIVILGVMNGFQMGFMDAVLELDSYHVRIDAPDAESYAAALPDTVSALPFIDVRTLAVGVHGSTEALRVKIVPDNATDLDPALAGLELRSGEFGRGLSVGSELARNMNLLVGDTVKVLAVTIDDERGIASDFIELRVGGIFHTGFYDFDSGLAFLPASQSGGLATGERTILGIKLRDRYADRLALSRLKAAGLAPGAAQSWRDYNRAFFGALRMEKNVMMALVGLIFLVVGVNIFHAMRKTVFARMEDIAVLKAVGARASEVRRVFLLDGLAAGAGGAFLGLAVGLALAVNVNEVFSAIESVLGFLASLFGGRGLRFFSPDLFYISDVPVRLPFAEAAFVTLAGAASALLAAWAASARVSTFMPSEVLRDE